MSNDESALNTLEYLNDNECDFIDEINIDETDETNSNIEDEKSEETDETQVVKNQYNYPDKYKSVMMKQYNDFSKYLSEQITYISIKQSIMGINLNIEKTEAKFSMNLKKREKKFLEVEMAPDGWEDYFDECYDTLMSAVDNVNEYVNAGKKIHPPFNLLFRAFDLVKPENVRVVVLGQDPYQNPGAAMGMAFSCVSKPQPSLTAIFNEIEAVEGIRPLSTDLTFWAKQGVLLLNMCLTVNDGDSGSHKNIWKPFILEILTKLFQENKHTFLCLWGAKAKSLLEGSNKLSFSSKKVTCLLAGHPSPLNKSTKVPFKGTNHFGQINDYYVARGEDEIDWTGQYVGVDF